MTQAIPKTPPEYDETRVFERPDGFYWQARDGGEEFGPFPTLIEAVRDMQARDDAAIEPGETVEEAESEIGIADWIDEETGLPAEENVPRVDDEH